MAGRSPTPRATSNSTLASQLLLLVPSCLMTLAPVTTRKDDHLSEAEVLDIMNQCGANVTRISGQELLRQLAPSELKGKVEFAYAGAIENYASLGVSGLAFAFMCVIGVKHREHAQQASERMAHHERQTTSARGFVAANVIVQRIAADSMNPSHLDHFLLERFAGAATGSRPVKPLRHAPKTYEEWNR